MTVAACANTSQSLYPQEKTIFFHDYRSAGGRYSTATFVLAFSLFALIPEVLSAMGFAAILHVGSGMQTSARIYFEFAIGCWAQLSFGESVGIVFCSYWSAMGLAVSLISCFLTVASQSSGVFSASIAKFLDVRRSCGFASLLDARRTWRGSSR